jgi:hypothetical protein
VISKNKRFKKNVTFLTLMHPVSFVLCVIFIVRFAHFHQQILKQINKTMLKISCRLISIPFTLLITLLFISCDNSTMINDKNHNHGDINYSEAEFFDKKNVVHTGGSVEGVVNEQLAELVNGKIAELGISGIEFAKAETFKEVKGGNFQSGQTIFANDRMKQLPFGWVPGDERRFADGNNLSYLVFEPLASANTTNSLPVIDAKTIFDEAFSTWNELKKNSGPEIIKTSVPGVIPSAIIGFGGFVNDPFSADIGSIGFVPGFLFDAVLGPGASESVLGVAFTFTFIGTNETAHVEIWYNDSFQWSDDGTPGTIDIESVAVHENGHALGFDHFGRIALVNANGRLNVSPRAVMNAAYLGPQRELLGTDKASFNQRYGSWPKD